MEGCRGDGVEHRVREAVVARGLQEGAAGEAACRECRAVVVQVVDDSVVELRREIGDHRGGRGLAV